MASEGYYTHWNVHRHIYICTASYQVDGCCQGHKESNHSKKDRQIFEVRGKLSFTGCFKHIFGTVFLSSEGMLDNE